MMLTNLIQYTIVANQTRRDKTTNLVDLAGDETIRVGLTDRYDAAGVVVLLGIGLEVPEAF